LDALEPVDRLAELLPLPGVLDRELERALGEPQRLRRHTRTREIERHHRAPEPLPFAAEHLIFRHAAILEMELDHGDATDAHLVLVLADPIARSARLDDECRNAARAAPGLRDREDRVVRGDGASGVPFLL